MGVSEKRWVSARDGPREYSRQNMQLRVRPTLRRLLMPPPSKTPPLNSEMHWHCSQALIDNFTVFLGRRTEIGMSTMSCWSVSDCTTHRLTALSWPHLGRDINLDDLEVTAAPVISQSSQVNTNKLSSKIHLIYIWDNWNEQFRSFVNFLKKMFWCLARSIFYSYKKSDWRDRGELR